jgi:hypothetical protein
MRIQYAVSSLVIGLALLLSLDASAAGKDKKRIAIGDPGVSAACIARTRTYAGTFAASLRTAIAETGRFSVVSRSQMHKILKEHEMTMTGLIDQSNAKTLGGFLQADLILAVELLCFDDHVELNVNLVDIETTEIVGAKRYTMKDLSKSRKAVNDLAKLMKKYAETGSMGEAGKGEVFQIVDSKAFADASEYIVKRIRYAIPKAVGTIEEINVYGETLKVKISYSGYDPWAGLKFKVVRDGEDVGWVYLKKAGRGSIEAGTNDDMSSFEEGDRISSEEFEPVVAFGFLEDVDEGVDELPDMFRERMQEILGQSDGVKPAEGNKISKLLQRLPPSPSKKDLANLHKAGVDLLVVGKFLGNSGKRRMDFDVLSTYDGKRVIEIKRDRIGL